VSRPKERRPSDVFLVTESAQDRRKRVEEIREHVSRGSYDVPAGDVADALVAFFRRDFPPDDDGNAGFVTKSC
jgi:predicted Holliday junction resolvase-like endonuclease